MIFPTLNPTIAISGTAYFLFLICVSGTGMSIQEKNYGKKLAATPFFKAINKEWNIEFILYLLNNIAAKCSMHRHDPDAYPQIVELYTRRCLMNTCKALKDQGSGSHSDIQGKFSKSNYLLFDTYKRGSALFRGLPTTPYG